MESNPFSPNPPNISQMLDQLWLKFRPQIEERVAVLQQAAAALAQGNLSPALRAEAHSAAHKLAGSLGTFGLDHGTALAREAETIYQGNPGPESAVRLVEIVESLKTMIASRG